MMNRDELVAGVRQTLAAAKSMLRMMPESKAWRRGEGKDTVFAFLDDERTPKWRCAWTLFRGSPLHGYLELSWQGQRVWHLFHHARVTDGMSTVIRDYLSRARLQRWLDWPFIDCHQASVSLPLDQGVVYTLKSGTVDDGGFESFCLEEEICLINGGPGLKALRGWLIGGLADLAC